MSKCYYESIEVSKKKGRDVEKILSGEGEDKLVYVCDCEDDDNKSECAYGEARSCCDCAWCCADASDCGDDKREFHFTVENGQIVCRDAQGNICDD
jgi:hypothetical protein